MAQEIQNPSFGSSAASFNLGSSNSKSDVEIRRDRKKKLAAFKTFLDNKLEPSPLEDLPKRKLSEEELVDVKFSSLESCKICNGQPSQQPKACEFCKEVVCTSHLRKRRRNPETNKWTRICEYCEDKYLMEKHYQNEMKTEESLMTQHLIVEKKHQELTDIVSSKKIKFQMLLNKQGQLEAIYKKEIARITQQENDLEKRSKKLEGVLRENGNLQLTVTSLEKSSPASLQAVYECLDQQNQRITKDLVKYEKLCNDVIKARSQREKEMYKEYYEWEQQKIQEIEKTEKGKEECCIY